MGVFRVGSQGAENRSENARFPAFFFLFQVAFMELRVYNVRGGKSLGIVQVGVHAQFLWMGYRGP